MPECPRCKDLERQLAEAKLKNAELQATIITMESARTAAREVTDGQIKDLKEHLATQEDHSLWIFKTKVDPALARVARLREALRIYARHSSTCMLIMDLSSETCTCGLEQALAGDGGQEDNNAAVDAG